MESASPGKPIARLKLPPEVEVLATVAVNSAFDVHRELGPGLLESSYEAAFVQELQSRRVDCRRQVPVPVIYKGLPIELGFRADVVLENKLLVELKAVEEIVPGHKARVITYLKILNFPLGLLINFNEVLIKHGIQRVLNLGHRPINRFAS